MYYIIDTCTCKFSAIQGYCKCSIFSIYYIWRKLFYASSFNRRTTYNICDHCNLPHGSGVAWRSGCGVGRTVIRTPSTVCHMHPLYPQISQNSEGRHENASGVTHPTLSRSEMGRIPNDNLNSHSNIQILSFKETKRRNVEKLKELLPCRSTYRVEFLLQLIHPSQGQACPRVKS